MKKIPLTHGKFAIVDDDVYLHLSPFKWHFDRHGYAKRTLPIGPFTRKKVSMHRMVAQTPKGMDTDHINGDKLDNRRENLRACTRSQNLLNRGAQKNSTTKQKGVFWYKRYNKYEVQLMVRKVKHNLGYYQSKDEAVRVAADFMKKNHGEFCRAGK